MTHFCKDCRHVITPTLTGFERCAKTQYIDPVSGRQSYIYCSIERRDGFNQCGPDAKFFEPVNQETTP